MSPVRTHIARLGLATALALAAGTAQAADGAANGRDVYEKFRTGLAEPGCPAQGAARWARQYGHTPRQLTGGGDTLAIFSHVVESVRAAHLPSEYALIPFVESGYKPGARSPAGPAGLWQFIGSTARNHKVPMRPGYDGRLSPVDSTRAAVRYLKTLHGMFGGNWRLAVMAYNVGEGRIFSALKRTGQSARTAKPESLSGLPDITRVYDDKLHAISCLIAQADDQPQWLAALDRPVQRLGPVAASDALVAMHPVQSKRRENPAATALAALAPSVVAPGSHAAAVASAAPAATQAETPVTTTAAQATAAPETATTVVAALAPAAEQRRHTVAAGESLWRIARRYGVSVADLLQINRLDGRRLIAPGTVLAIDALQRP
jgi:membrane-bound lytic murein transglycosylase D